MTSAGRRSVYRISRCGRSQSGRRGEMRSKFLVIGAIIALMLCACAAFADDVILNGGNTVTFSGAGIGVAYSEEHGDLDPFKGSAYVSVINDSEDYWSDFHFKVFKSSPTSIITNTIFVDGGTFNPTSSQSGLSWVITNTYDPLNGAEMELKFTSFVAPGGTAWFKVYTDNTVNKTKFGMMVWPTSDYVPEPSSLLALSSCLGLAGIAWRKRK
jgi:hypothetical protein